MIKVRYALTALALAAAACSPPASDTTPSQAPVPETPAAPAASGVPADIAAVASAAAPGLTITSGELGNNDYEVTGTMPNGEEVELDLVQSNGSWTVLEIQQDVAWSSVPEPVRAAAAAAPNPFEPVRVIESTQAADGSVVYELFSETGGGPAMEVRWHDEMAEVISPAP